MKSGLKIGLLLVVVGTNGCWRQVHPDNVITPQNAPGLAVDPDQRYQDIRARWTIRLSSLDRSDGARPGLPFSPRGGGEMYGGMFPLTITATLMVDEVMDAGLLYYEKMAEMSPQQADSFSQNYRQGNQLDQYVLIEVSLQTSWAENYLDLKRYTIFIEDDQQNKLEPARIVEQPVITYTRPVMMPGRDHRRSGYTEWAQHQKTVFLYFLRKDFYGKPVLRAGIKELKIVFILEEGGSGRVDGKWIFPD
jgi:hypothetical protein